MLLPLHLLPLLHVDRKERESRGQKRGKRENKAIEGTLYRSRKPWEDIVASSIHQTGETSSSASPLYVHTGGEMR